MKKDRVLIDCDPGIDDALALMLALKGNLNIAAVSVTAGNVGLSQAYANTKFILSKLDSDISPISGSKKPLEKSLQTTKVHGKTGLGEINIEPVEAQPNIKKIINTIKEKEIRTVVALGPLTNIAKLIKEEALGNQLKEIIIMGGAINTKGNVTKYAEFNIYTDPEAANIVLSSSIKKTLIPIDVCHKATLQKNFIDKLNNKLASKLLKPYLKSNKEEGLNNAPMYDPLTVYYLINRQAFKTKKERIKIIDQGKQRGKTEKSKGGSDVEIATDIKADQFKKDFIGVLNLR